MYCKSAKDINENARDVIYEIQQLISDSHTGDLEGGGRCLEGSPALGLAGQWHACRPQGGVRCVGRRGDPTAAVGGIVAII